MDIRKYFDSIHQATLRELLERKFKDAGVLDLFDRILASYETAPGRGLPIGNLTSQHFANFYLSPLDRFLKEKLCCGAYVRYMDDFVVWGGSGPELREVCERVRPMRRVDFTAADAGAAGLYHAGGERGVSAAHIATLWGGDQKAPTVCYGAATGTTTPTTAGRRTATTTTRTTRTTTSGSALSCPQLNPAAGRRRG